MPLQIGSVVTTQLGRIGNVYGLAEVKTALELLESKIDEVASLEIFFGDGAAADTDIAIAGLKTTATVKFAAHVRSTDAAAGAALTDLTSEAVILTAGNLQFTDTATNGANTKVLVIYYNHD